jgi:YVTN family beta-propeller protein
MTTENPRRRGALPYLGESWMYEASKSRERIHVAAALLAAGALTACSGGGGGSSNHGNVVEPLVQVVGPTGRYSMTPSEANTAHGVVKPPLMPPATQNGENQYLRLEVPFAVRASDIMSSDPIYGPFSHLTGSLSFTDETGRAVPGIVMVNGVDAFGKFRGKDVGFPHDLTAGGQDRNLGVGVILFVADDALSPDEKLDTIAAFGGSSQDSDALATTTDIKQLRISLSELSGISIEGFWTITIDDGTLGDKTLPTCLSMAAESPDPAAPLDPHGCSPHSRFVAHFSEPCVPSTVGKSALLDGKPFLGNLPLIATPPAPPAPPLPHTYITATLNSATSPLYIPCDVEPLNTNNLATYVITPLIDLPTNRQVTLVVVDSQANQNPLTGEFSGPIDLAGNFKLSGDFRTNFNVGKGRAPVNAPVSPEVFYWLPIDGRGVGAVDLNGFGATTNTPGKWDNTRINATTGTREYDPDKSAQLWQHAAIVTKSPNTANGIGILGAPNGGYSRFRWPVGLGSYVYGPALSAGTADFSVGGENWQGQGNDLGNTGTPIPGVNEMSSGFETLVRNADGEVLLTGASGDIGNVADLVTGEFLDAGIFDTQSIFAAPNFHVSGFWGAGITRNNIGDPPICNPPPSRFWVGLNPIDILIDQSNPLGVARLIEGDEVWNAGGRSYALVRPSDITPTSIDQTPFAGFGNGPAPQTGTAVSVYAARQQVGNYLYAVDTENKALQVLNSNTFQTIATIDLPDPSAVGVMPDNRFVFTSNAGDDTMSIIGSDPTKVDFHKEVARIAVGKGPATISCQMDGEDVFVVNSLDDTVSIVNLKTLSVRKTLTSLMDGPRDIVCTPRQGAFGWNAGVYFAYIANFSGNNVVVYESGPDGPQGIGCNNVLGTLPTQSSNQTIIEPRGMCYSPFPDAEGLYAGGVFVAHRDENGFGLVTHIQFVHQALFGPLPCVLPPGRFFIPPGFNVRLFDIVGRWGDHDGSRLIGSKPSSVVLTDFRTDQYRMFPAQPPSNDLRGTPGFGGASSRHPIRFIQPPDPRAPHMPVVEPDRMYVAFEDSDTIQIIDPIRVGISIGTIEPAGVGVRKLVSYFDSQ